MIATIQINVAGTPTQARQVLDAEERKREAVDLDAGVDRDSRRSHLAAQLRPPGQAAKVVDYTDAGRNRRPEQDSAIGATQLQERKRGHEDPEQERDSTQPRDRPDVDPPGLTRLVDDAEDSREAPDGRREDEDDAEREQEAPDDFGVVSQRLPHGRSRAYFVPYRRSPASPRPGTM